MRAHVKGWWEYAPLETVFQSKECVLEQCANTSGAEAKVEVQKRHTVGVSSPVSASGASSYPCEDSE